MARTRRWTFRLFTLFVVLILAAVLIAAGQYFRPLPIVKPTVYWHPAQVSAKANISWPAAPEAAIGAKGFGQLASNGPQTPRPTASVAKVITALAVLEKHPLQLGQQGPALTFDNTDVGFYNQYAAEGGSVEPIQNGEQLSEYETLEAMLLPSANNLADSLARWAYGSLPAYSTAANQLVKNWGLTQTIVGVDASGFDPSTMSTASDLVTLGLKAMQDPVLAHIVSQAEASNTAGLLRNTNYLLGQDGIIGIKTGNTDQAGGVFIGASQTVIGGQNVTIVTAVMGTADLESVLSQSAALLTSAAANFQFVPLAKAGMIVGNYKTPWGSTASTAIQKDLSLVTWKGLNSKSAFSLQPIKTPQTSGASVGNVSFDNGVSTISSPIVLQQKLGRPSFWWRIFRR